MKFKIICLVLIFMTLTVSGLQAEDATSLHINLDVKNMSIIDVLRLLAEQGQVNIVASKNVQGRITAKLQGITVEEALGAILDANNFIYKKENNIIKVYARQDILQQEQTEKLVSRVFLLVHIKATDFRQVLNSIKSARGRVEINTVSNQVIVTDTLEKMAEIEQIIADSDMKMVTKIYNLNYADANSLKDKLIEMIPKQAGDVFVDERTNGIVIRAVSETIEKVDLLMQSWDKRSSQVLIEAKILEVSLDKTKGLGVSWEYQSSSNNDATSLSASLPASISGGGIFKVGTLTQDEYTVTIQALESSTNTNILSNPRIVVVDNTEANILVGSAEPYLVTYIDKETNTQTEETKFIDVGVKLNVTPKISKDDYITLKIHPEVSSARRVAEVNNALAVDTTQADTTVVVKNGQTIVMGGLIKDTSSKVQAKVPVLGSIPIIGLFFRSHATAKIKKEIVVFITPHILENSETRITVGDREQAMKQAIQEAANKWDEWEGEKDYE